MDLDDDDFDLPARTCPLVGSMNIGKNKPEEKLDNQFGTDKRPPLKKRKTIAKKAQNRDANIKQFYTRTRTQILEARKLEGMKNIQMLEEKMPDDSDQDHFNAMKYGNFELPSIVQHFERSSAQQALPTSAYQVECTTRTMNISSPERTLIPPTSPPKHTVVRKFYSRTQISQIVEGRTLQDISSNMDFAAQMALPSEQQHFESMKIGNTALPSVDHLKSSPCKQNNCSSPNKIQIPFIEHTQSSGRTYSADGGRVKTSSEQKFFDDVIHGNYQRDGMIELFKRSFDKGKQIISDDEFKQRYEVLYTRAVEQEYPSADPNIGASKRKRDNLDEAALFLQKEQEARQQGIKRRLEVHVQKHLLHIVVRCIGINHTEQIHERNILAD